MAVEVIDLEDDYIIRRRGSNKRIPISVESYVPENRNLGFLHSATQSIVDLSKDEEEEVQILDYFNPLPRRKRLRTGEPSGARQEFTCEICVETKPLSESFNVKGCTHFYCADCVSKYVSSKFQDGIIRIGCPVPGCSGLLDPEYCRPILPPEVFGRWIESLIPDSQKFYCPYKDCSALLIKDGSEGGEVIDKFGCPYCGRLFCFRCRVEWHSGIDCVKFQGLNKDEREKEDLMLMKLAEDRGWQRCPRCKFYVERTEGCPNMVCRCGCNFCYKCGGSPCKCGLPTNPQLARVFPTTIQYAAGAAPVSTQHYYAPAISFPAPAPLNPVMNPYLFAQGYSLFPADASGYLANAAYLNPWFS